MIYDLRSTIGRDALARDLSEFHRVPITTNSLSAPGGVKCHRISGFWFLVLAALLTLGTSHPARCYTSASATPHSLETLPSAIAYLTYDTNGLTAGQGVIWNGTNWVIAAVSGTNYVVLTNFVTATNLTGHATNQVNARIAAALATNLVNTPASVTNLAQLANWHFSTARSANHWAAAVEARKKAITWVERWDNLNSWFAPTNLGVTNIGGQNRLYNISGGATPHAKVAREFRVQSNECALITTTLIIPPTNATTMLVGSNGFVCVGFNLTTVSNAIADASFYGAGMTYNVGNSSNAWTFATKSNNTFVNHGGVNFQPNTTNVVNIAITPNNISWVIQGGSDGYGHTNEWRTNFTRSGGFSCVTNIEFLNGDTLALRGASFGPVAVRKAFAGFAPRTGVVNTNFVFHTRGNYGQKIRVELPPEFNGDPIPVIVVIYGTTGSRENAVHELTSPASADRTYWQEMIKGLGCGVVSVDAQIDTPYGNEQGLTNILDGMAVIESLFPVSAWIGCGDSAGGAMLPGVIAARKFQFVSGYYHYPVFDMAYTAQNNASADDLIFAAYGITLGDYPALTNAVRGRDPVTIEPARWAIPQWVYSSPADGSVSVTNNAQAVERIMTNGLGWAPFTIFYTSGGHGGVTNYQAWRDIQLIKQYANISKPNPAPSIDGAIQPDGLRFADQVVTSWGWNTNLTVLTPGATESTWLTNTLRITNGLLRAISQ